jgi:hypothetical protein
MVEVWICTTMALQSLQQYGCQTGNKLKEKSRDLNRNSSRFYNNKYVSIINSESVSGCICLILLLPLTLPKRERNILKVHWTKDLYSILYINPSNFSSCLQNIKLKNNTRQFSYPLPNIVSFLFEKKSTRVPV